MAITNAQQFKQLVNPPMKGNKRPGYRGDDAARSTGAERSGRADPGRAPRGEGPKTGAPSIGMINEIRRQNLEKAPDVKEQPNKFNFLDFVPGIGAVRRIASVFGPLDNREFFQQKVVPAGRTNLNFDDYMKARQAGLIDAYGNPIDQDNDNNIILPQTMSQAPSNIDQETEEDDMDDRFLRFRAEGGPIGGEYDFESARQMYGLGKLVKKVGRTVKKIAKSPIGKAALLYAGTAGLGALGAGAARAGTGFGIFAPSAVKANLGTAFTRFMGGKLMSDPIGLFAEGQVGKQNLLQRAIGAIPGGVTGAIVGASALAGLLTPKQELQAQQLAEEEGIDIEAARNSILARAQGNIQDDFRARGFRAEGGPAEGKEPVAKKTMPLLDMGGKEMDLREEGGFVPIGRMEKADDVPARLSKNEFVFTADAVRNAGDGDVDKGAEVMYNMMKNLEAGGDVSEESQGKEGARRMFQTSQRLEEVL